MQPRAAAASERSDRDAIRCDHTRVHERVRGECRANAHGCAATRGRTPSCQRRSASRAAHAASYNCRFNHRLTRLHWQYWALQGSIDRVRKALLRGAAIDGGVRSTTARVYASWHRHVAVVRELLDCGANANARDKKGGTTLHQHSMMLAWRVVRSTARASLLVSRGADVNAWSVHYGTPLDNVVLWHRRVYHAAYGIERLLVEASRGRRH